MTSTATKPAKSATKAKPAPKKEAAPKPEPAAPLPTSLVEAATSGAAQLFKVRANGTMRSLPYLAPGTEERSKAEHVAALRTAGKTVGDIATDLKVSVATVRRYVTNLALAQAVEAGTHDAKWTPETKRVVVHEVKKAAA